MKKVGKIIENVIFVLLLVPLIIITVRISYQVLIFKDKIPDIYGYKLFIIFDENLESSLKYGDFIITYNENIDRIKENDLIAYRDGINSVKILNINEIQESYDINSEKNEKIFIANISKDNEYDIIRINEEKIEGLEILRIPKLGNILYQITKPRTIIIVSFVILMVGNVCIYIAKVLDEKETIKTRKRKNKKTIQFWYI